MVARRDGTPRLCLKPTSREKEEWGKWRSSSVRIQRGVLAHRAHTTERRCAYKVRHVESANRLLHVFIGRWYSPLQPIFLGDAALRRSFRQLKRATDTWCAVTHLAA